MRVVRLVLDGKLMRVGYVLDRTGFDGVAVDAEEVRYRLHREHPVGLSLKDAANELMAAIDAVRELIAAAYLPAVEDPKTSETRVPEAAFNALSAAYAIASRAAQRQRMHYKTFDKAFADLEPAFVLPSGTRFYAWKEFDLP